MGEERESTQPNRAPTGDGERGRERKREREGPPLETRERQPTLRAKLTSLPSVRVIVALAPVTPILRPRDDDETFLFSPLESRNAEMGNLLCEKGQGRHFSERGGAAGQRRREERTSKRFRGERERAGGLEKRRRLLLDDDDDDDNDLDPASILSSRRLVCAGEK